MPRAATALGTAALYALPALLIGTAWAGLGRASWDAPVLGLALLALLPALVRPWWGRAVAAAAAALVALGAIYDVSLVGLLPFEDRRFFGPVVSDFRAGVLDFYDVSLPFTAADRPLMRAAVLVAVFGFAILVALAVAARRPLLASVALVAGSVWPATLVHGSELARGALTLAVVLMLLALGGRRPTLALQPAVLAAALLVAAAVGASTSAAVAKPEFLRWKTWDFYDKPAEPVGVGYVWDSSYRPLKWPKEKTKVLTVRGPTRSLYWRATTLDDFVRDRWVEELSVVGIADGRVDVTQFADALVPRRAYERDRWLTTRVTVEGLRDTHLVAPGMPVAYDPQDIGSLLIHSGGVATAGGILPRGTEYAVSSYAPAPRPQELAEVTGRGPDWATARYREVAPGRVAPPFGARGRDEAVRNLLRPGHASNLARYAPLYDRALRVVGDPKNAYAAVVTLEAWFRSQGGFEYDESPPSPGDAPPLVAFLRDQRGYCQHFAGAMTLMLRYLGIPARVAVGFTSGSYDRDSETWTVTDHDAHAWVEVWFPGWGWLAFDPTPARAQLSGPYSFGADNFDAEGAAGVVGESGGGESSQIARGLLNERRVGEQFQADRPGGGYVPIVRERGASLIKLLALVAAAAAAAIVLVKRAVRGRRYLTRDARRLAGAYRLELADFLADQAIELPRSATPRELAAAVDRALGVDGAAFARALSAARYARPEESRAAARRLRRELRALRRSIRRQLGVPRRLRGSVSLRSLAA